MRNEAEIENKLGAYKSLKAELPDSKYAKGYIEALEWVLMDTRLWKIKKGKSTTLMGKIVNQDSVLGRMLK